MPSPRRMLPAAVGIAAAGAVLAPIAAASGPAITTPKLVKTTIGQYSNQMGVDVIFKISKADDQYPIKATITVLGRSKSMWVQRAGLPAASALAQEIVPNVAFRANELNRTVKVTTTLYVGSRHFTYHSKAKDTVGHVG